MGLDAGIRDGREHGIQWMVESLYRTAEHIQYQDAAVARVRPLDGDGYRGEDYRQRHGADIGSDAGGGDAGVSGQGGGHRDDAFRGIGPTSARSGERAEDFWRGDWIQSTGFRYCSGHHGDSGDWYHRERALQRDNRGYQIGGGAFRYRVGIALRQSGKLGARLAFLCAHGFR